MTATSPWTTEKPTALLVLADGTVIEGKGIGATGTVQAEVCFNTALTGYQEILTDPSYLGQIVTFTFPHIGNIGANDEDIEDLTPAARHGAVGVIFKADITDPSSYRAAKHLDAWLKARGIIGMCGIDTRALTAWIRENGAPNAVIAHDPNGVFDIDALKAEAKAWSGLEGLDLAKIATSGQSSRWSEKPWVWNEGYGELAEADTTLSCRGARLSASSATSCACSPGWAARSRSCRPSTSAEEVLAQKPDGIFLSNGPGDPAATGEYAVPVIQELIKTDIPVFGICLGHQMLGLALGAKTEKMHQGHHGANHPVKDHTTGKVEIVSMNHGFAVDAKSLPEGVEETHVSLFDGTNCGLRLTGKPVFSVQHHPGSLARPAGQPLSLPPLHQSGPRQKGRAGARRARLID